MKNTDSIEIDLNEDEAEKGKSFVGRPNFFCGMDALNVLLGKDYDDDQYRDFEISMDFIELTLYFVNTYDEESWTVIAYLGGEFNNVRKKKLMTELEVEIK